jgi:hypothetical protein
VQIFEVNAVGALRQASVFATDGVVVQDDVAIRMPSDDGRIGANPMRRRRRRRRKFNEQTIHFLPRNDSLNGALSERRVVFLYYVAFSEKGKFDAAFYSV